MPHGTTTMTLRDWQRQALDLYRNPTPPSDFLAVATPGAGKTRWAATVLEALLTNGAAQQIVVVVPSTRLREQWANSLYASHHIALNPAWANHNGTWTNDFRGVVVTYAQVASNPGLFAMYCSRTDTVAVFDEIHHCGEQRSWGDALRTAFAPALHRIALSGTPFRSDTNPIPFIRYTDESSDPDFTYGYGQAVADGACRRVFFTTVDGEFEWSSRPGETISCDFDTPLWHNEQGRRLRTALMPDGNYLRRLISEAHDCLLRLRSDQPDAGGLILAIDQHHAHAIARIIRDDHAVDAVVAVSDDPTSQQHIDRFATSDEPWIVAVRMVSEGVDIPRLRVAVHATNTTAELFFRQAVGRIVRHTDTEHEDAYYFIPADPRLRDNAARIEEERDHDLDDDPDALTDPRDEEDPPPTTFVPIAARATVKGMIASGEVFDGAALAEAEQFLAANPEFAKLNAAEVIRLKRALSSTQPTLATSTAQSRDVLEEPPHRRRETLKKRNSDIARRIAYRHQTEFRDVNATLNRATGIRRVDDATIEQLEERLAAATRWLAGEGGVPLYARDLHRR
ncbi:DEAD/DEAH box helicase [Euzebya tangerina]|uniref:DEAD/DEAH box helicase n=1 Tax=Euzebya tangerina TaxID=591198 RepID=UPI000E32174C|nr:DEAD/DEAH box helicase family protein [Euzebya tangerina]